MASLFQKRDRLREELRAVENAIEALQAAQRAGGLDIPLVAPSQVAEPTDAGKMEPVLPPEPKLFKGMAMPQAVRHALKLAGKQMVATDILEVLRDDHAAPSGDDPHKKIQVALNRRAKTHGDVVHVGWGEWGLKEWYTPEELEKFSALIDGANARDKRRHRKQMKEGIKRAQERGAYYGGPPKITPEQWARARELAAAGERKISAIHREVVKLTPKGEKPMVYETLRKYSGQIIAQEPYPSQWQAYYDHAKRDVASVDDPEPKIRVVK